MISFLIILQFVIVILICIAVLLQKSSSIGLGTYSGSNENLFGAKGPAGFLAKFTFILGVLLIANTIALGYLYNNTNSDSIAEKIKTITPKSPTSDQNKTLNSKAQNEQTIQIPKAPVLDANSTKD